jgi:hypothetical protein
MTSDYNEWSKMVGEIKKSYPLAQQYLEKVYVLDSCLTDGRVEADESDERSL